MLGNDDEHHAHSEEMIRAAGGGDAGALSSSSTAAVSGSGCCCCLSIVYSSPEEQPSSESSLLESLDLVVPDPAQYRELVQTLQDLIVWQRRELEHYTPTMQFLHFHWMGLGQAWHAPLTSKEEWYALADRVQAPVKRSTLLGLWKERAHNDQLSFRDVALLLEDVRAQATAAAGVEDPLERLWLELVDTDPVPRTSVVETPLRHRSRSNNYADDVLADLELSILHVPKAPTISAVAFLSFVRSQQKNYGATLEEVTELVRALNRQESLGDSNIVNNSSGNQKDNDGDDDNEDRLSKHRFCAWLTSDGNDIFDPDCGGDGADVPTAPLSHYWISTSHDTYLASLSGGGEFNAVPGKYKNSSSGSGSGGTTVGPTEVDASMYLMALQRGVRCIELDVWEDVGAAAGQQPVLVVARCRPSSSSSSNNNNNNVVSVQSVLKVVRYFMNRNPYTTPVILKLENHCSTEVVQHKLANLLYVYLGAANLLFKPMEGDLLSNFETLPSVTLARGKVILMGKRPKTAYVGCTVIKDDFDDENDGWEVLDPGFFERVAALEDESEEDADKGTVVGFDTKGVIHTTERNVLKRSAKELLEMAEADAKRAVFEREEAAAAKSELLDKVDQHEALAAQLTLEAGMTVEEVKARAAKAANRNDSSDYADAERFLEEHNKNREEGVEVHEILPVVMESSQDAYAEAAQEAMEASGLATACAAKLKEAEMDLQRAENDLQMSRQLAENRMENARRAAAEARSHQEYADSAKERVERVRNLLRSSEVHASSAGTVVQTALTEAKISEKRATDAETRATRARTAAEKDRARAEEETKKEEEMEQEVSDLHMTVQEASASVKETRANLDKANTMFDRVNEQIKLIERSSNFRDEMLQNNIDQMPRVRHGGSYIAKHSAKMEEKADCRERIKEASEERSAAETRLIMLKSKYEDRSRMWRAQANIAAQARRNADRSSQNADELEEHAAEEREAAQLRSIAREKAVEAVERKGTHRESVEAQLAEAERAAAEASAIAMQSRNRAYKMEKDISRLQNHDSFVQTVEEKKLAVQLAQKNYEIAKGELLQKDAATEKERRRLETSSSMYKSATRDAASEQDRVKVAKVLQQEAIVAYNATLILRQQVDEAYTRFDISVEVAEAKQLAAEHAKEYKKRMDMLVEIPVMLAKTTLVHTSKFLSWDRSMSSSNACAHSFAQNVLLKMVDEDPEETVSMLRTYTKDHMCRAFPPWKALQSKATCNFDPVFAWSLGCQLVAMNLFAADENLLVADGRFRQNGSCGYVLKPQWLTDSAVGDAETKETWSFTVLAGYNLPKPGRKIIRPVVRVSLYAGSTTEARIMSKTKPIAGHNGLNPVWDANCVYTFEVKSPSIAMVSFSVWDKQDDNKSNKGETFVAGAAVPVSGLREGYRSVALFNGDHSRTGPLRYASLLVKANKR